jgi:hypothetical protein
MTTATVTRTTNPATLVLVIGGVVSAIVGAILWITGANTLGQDQLTDGYMRSISADNNGGAIQLTNSTAITADQTMIWWGVALVILGVLMILSWVIIRAARR